MKPSGVLDHDTSKIASGGKFGMEATKTHPDEGFNRPWPPLMKLDAALNAKMRKLFNS